VILKILRASHFVTRLDLIDFPHLYLTRSFQRYAKCQNVEARARTMKRLGGVVVCTVWCCWSSSPCCNIAQALITPLSSLTARNQLVPIASNLARRDNNNLVRTTTTTAWIPPQTVLAIRGGGGGGGDPSTMLAPVTAALVSSRGALMAALQQAGPLSGVAVLTAIGAAVCIPATQYNALYGVSVGYGLSVAAMASTLLIGCSVPPFSMAFYATTAAISYGLRLALYLWVRDITKAKPIVSPNKPQSRLQRIPFAISLALFYACLATPLLFMVRHPVVRVAGTTTSRITTENVSWLVACTGTIVACMGALLEAVADTHKYIVKAHQAPGTVAFRGPCNGVYRWTRHPNYTGEVLFWSGLWLAGMPSFGSSIVAWVASTAGLYGIVSIMRGAANKLEQRQAEKYRGQPKYEAWKKMVPAPLIPFLASA
jgi:steroid 5-alpha reductase family enzyme